jgi:hypothetical protein
MSLLGDKIWWWIKYETTLRKQNKKVTCDRSVVFSTNKTDCHDITENNIVESGIKHHNPHALIFNT